MAQFYDIRFDNKDCMVPLQLNNNILNSAKTPELDRFDNPTERIWELDDLLPMYPDQNIPNIQTYITAKEEFIEKSAPAEEPIPEKGQFFSYQELFHRYGMLYDRIINIQRAGTGKTGAGGGLALKIKRHRKLNEVFDFIDLFSNRHRSNIKRVIILVPNKIIGTEFRNQLIYKYGLPGEFDIDALQEKETRGAKTKAMNTMLTDFIKIETYRTLAGRISGMTDEKLHKEFDDSLIIGDELHNLRIESGEGIAEETGGRKKRRQAATYEIIHHLFHVILRATLIGMSASLAINDAAEVIDHFNLFLPLDQQIPNDRVKFKEMTIDELEPYYRGKISYIRESGTYVVLKQIGEYTSGDLPGTRHVYNIKGQEYLTSKKIYAVPMYTKVEIDGKIADTPTQGAVYLDHIRKSGVKITLNDIDEEDIIDAAKAEVETEDTTDNIEVGSGKNNNFFRQTGKLKQISNGIFPDGSYGTEGFDKYIKFDEYLNDYVGTPELIEFISNINYLRILSIKYAEIISIVKDTNRFPGPCYGYTHLKLGSGAIYLGICLEQHGFEKYRGLSYPFKNDPKNTHYDPSCSPINEDNFCTADELLRVEKHSAISDAFPKKLRYAILTSGMGEAAIINIMELYSSPENIDGEYLKFLIITPFGSEGINLSHSTAFILIDPAWNPAGDYQPMRRGIRELSHIYKLIQLKQMYPQDPNIKLDIEIYNMAAYIEGMTGSWELSLYNLSESKDIEIKINERREKMIAFDKELHKRRNERPTDIDKNGTEECDYMECTYPMYDPLPPPGYIDYSTYDILYSDELLLNIIQDIKVIFKENYSITLQNLMYLLKDYRKKSVLKSLEKIVTHKIPIINRIGNVSYLYEDGENLFVYDEVPVASNIVTNNTYSLTYYNKYLIATDISNIEDYISDEQSNIQNKAIELILSNQNIEILRDTFEQLSLPNKVKVFEDLVINMYKGAQPTPLSTYIFNKYKKSFFVEKEPIRDIALSSQSLSSANGNKPGKKSKNRVQTNVELSTVSPYKVDIPINSTVGEEVVIHILYGDLQPKSAIAVSSTFKNAEGRIRIFSKSTGVWRDTNNYELPVYREIIVERRKEDIEKFKDKGLYGTILDDGKFRIVNNPKGVEYMDGRKTIKGAMCKDMHKPVLAQIMYNLNIDLGFLPRIASFSYKDATDYLIKEDIDISKLESNQITYYYHVLMSKVTRPKLCAVIQDTMESRGLIYKHNV